MALMCKGATAYTGTGVDGWDTSKVTTLQGAFEGAEEMVSDVSQWDISVVTDLSTMFKTAFKFDGNLGSWDTGSVEKMTETFSQASAFTGTGVGMWNVAKVVDFEMA